MPVPEGAVKWSITFYDRQGRGLHMPKLRPVEREPGPEDYEQGAYYADPVGGLWKRTETGFSSVHGPGLYIDDSQVRRHALRKLVPEDVTA